MKVASQPDYWFHKGGIDTANPFAAGTYGPRAYA